MAKDRYGNERIALTPDSVKNVTTPLPAVKPAPQPRHAMPGDVLVGPQDDMIFRPVAVAGVAARAAESMARIASAALQDGYMFVQVVLTGGGEGVMVFRKIR